jgi:hypothetical protein
MTIAEPDVCTNCGRPLIKGRSVIACGPGGGYVALPPYCGDTECRKERDEMAIQAAIAAGVIEP